MINLNHLRFARTLAKTLSFSRAADICCVTQPTLSNGVGQLEEALGGALFRRTTRQVGLTRFGAHMLPRIEEALTAVDEVKSAAAAWHDPAHKLLRIGLSPVVDIAILEKALAPYREDHGDVDIFFKQCFIQDLEGRLMEGSVDVAITPVGLLPRSYPRTPLYSEALFFLPQEIDGEPVPELEACPIAHASRYPMILTQGCGLSDAIGALFSNHGLTMSLYPGQALDYSTVESWAELGIGAGILPLSRVSDGNRTALPLMLPSGAARLALEVVWAPDAMKLEHVAALQSML